MNSPDGKPLSQRVAAYWIDATLNTEAKTLDATEILEYRNPSGPACFDHPLSSLPQRFPSPIHFFRGVAPNGIDIPYAHGEQGAIDIKSISADGYGDLSPEHAIHRA